MQEEQQINVEVSRATTAEEEAQGKGSVDEIMEVQEVTESSGPLQTPNGLASAHSFRQRHGFKEKPVPIREEENGPVLQPSVSSSSPHCLHPISEVQSAVDTVKTKKLNEAMEKETKANTHSNLSLENAENSCKSETTEWTLQIITLLLEAISVIFYQLGNPLTSMVMAFISLLLSILDIIRKAREKEGTKCDGRGLLPSFNRHDVQNRKPSGGLVVYYGLAGAVWQCFETTIGYYYARQNLDDPIKICLLPFIFALCVLIFKVFKSSQHER